jgi:magnesium transporter
MSTSPDSVVAALNLRFLLDYPREAARKLESLPARDVAALLAAQPNHAVVPVWQFLAGDVEQAVVPHLPDSTRRPLLTELEPAQCAALMNRLDREQRDTYLAALDPQVANEIRSLMAYPPDTAGEMMDPRIGAFRADVTVQVALTRLRATRRRGLRELFLLDDHGRLDGRVFVQDLALAEPEQSLGSLKLPIAGAVEDTAPREEVVEKLQNDSVSDLPVVNFDGKPVGVIRQPALVSAVQEETLVDIQTMVGASKDEGALSPTTFAVIKRLPWLQINLLTAFLAAAVVGLFESTIARFTALAVLMPVVAGQSGNAGAQALAVTMRGLVLREISPRHWPKVVFKEINVGLLNGLGIAVTTALGVYVWSRSLGLVLVIVLSMVISMIVAGFAGALVPIVLRRLGQDPAQSSSIILTTVTDVVGFSSFLGIATLLASLLENTSPT